MISIQVDYSYNIECADVHNHKVFSFFFSVKAESVILIFVSVEVFFSFFSSTPFWGWHNKANRRIATAARFSSSFCFFFFIYLRLSLSRIHRFYVRRSKIIHLVRCFFFFRLLIDDRCNIHNSKIIKMPLAQNYKDDVTLLEAKSGFGKSAIGPFGRESSNPAHFPMNINVSFHVVGNVFHYFWRKQSFRVTFVSLPAMFFLLEKNWRTQLS